MGYVYLELYLQWFENASTRCLPYDPLFVSFAWQFAPMVSQRIVRRSGHVLETWRSLRARRATTLALSPRDLQIRWRGRLRSSKS